MDDCYEWPMMGRRRKKPKRKPPRGNRSEMDRQHSRAVRAQKRAYDLGVDERLI